MKLNEMIEENIGHNFALGTLTVKSRMNNRRERDAKVLKWKVGEGSMDSYCCLKELVVTRNV